MEAVLEVHHRILATMDHWVTHYRNALIKTSCEIKPSCKFSWTLDNLNKY